MPTQIVKPVRTKTTGQEGGARAGRNIGAGLGAVIGGVAGGIAGVSGGPAGIAVGAAKGAAGGTTLGAGLGSTVGDIVQPETRQTQQFQLDTVPVASLAKNSQKLLDGVRALNQYPDLARKFQTPLTQAYFQTQMELKRRG
jgi:phage tail tape-measure protein